MSVTLVTVSIVCAQNNTDTTARVWHKLSHFFSRSCRDDRRLTPSSAEKKYPRRHVNLSSSVSSLVWQSNALWYPTNTTDATDVGRRKETHYDDRIAGTKFLPFTLETYGAFSDRSDRFLVECATLASTEYAHGNVSTQYSTEHIAEYSAI